MSDFTTERGQLQDWTTLDDTGGVPTSETSALDGTMTGTLSECLEAMLHIVMAHQDANDASTNNAGYRVLIKVNSNSDEDWRTFFEVQATGGQANAQVLAANSGSGQANPERIEVAATANFDTPGDVYFLKDAGTLADSCIVVNQDVVTNDYVEHIDDLVNAYDTSDYLYDIVDQWDVLLPRGIQDVKVLFYNTDADATYATRVDYTAVTDIE